MPTGNTPRHAYLIAAHNKPKQLVTLLRLLDDPQNDIYIHIDRKAAGFSEAALRAAAPDSRVVFVPRRDARWGDEVFIDVIVSLLALAAEEEHAFYHLLSGVDLPLKSQREVHAFFEANAGKEFVAFDRAAVDPAMLYDRIGRIHMRQPVRPLAQKLFRRINPAWLKLQKRLGVDRTKISSVSFQKGAVWFSITHACARYVLDQAPRYRARYRGSLCADEIWLQTILANSAYMECRAFMGFDDEPAATMRYVDWSGGGASPRTLKNEDFEMLMDSGMLFARKFDETTDADIIRKIERRVLSQR